MRRKSLKGMLARRIGSVSDQPQLTDTELLLSASNSLIQSMDDVHRKLNQPHLTVDAEAKSNLVHRTKIALRLARSPGGDQDGLVYLSQVDVMALLACIEVNHES